MSAENKTTHPPEAHPELSLSQFSNIAAETEQLLAESQALAAECADLQFELDHQPSAEELEGIQQALQREQQELEEIAPQIAQLEADCEDLRRKVAAEKHMLSQAREKVDGLQKEYEGFSKYALEELLPKLKEKEDALKKMNEKLKAIKEENSAKRTQLNELREQDREQKKLLRQGGQSEKRTVKKTKKAAPNKPATVAPSAVPSREVNQAELEKICAETNAATQKVNLENEQLESSSNDLKTKLDLENTAHQTAQAAKRAVDAAIAQSQQNAQPVEDEIAALEAKFAAMEAEALKAQALKAEALKAQTPPPSSANQTPVAAPTQAAEAPSPQSSAEAKEPKKSARVKSAAIPAQSNQKAAPAAPVDPNQADIDFLKQKIEEKDKAAFEERLNTLKRDYTIKGIRKLEKIAEEIIPLLKQKEANKNQKKSGKKKKKGLEKAADSFLSIAKKAYAHALMELAYCYEIGRKPLPQNKREALKLYKEAAVQEESLKQFVSEKSALKGGKVSQESLIKAASGGLARAQYRLGMHYLVGNAPEAVKFFKLASARNLPAAHCELARCYFDGFGVLRDEKESVRLAGLAAEQQDHQGLFLMGLAYEMGQGGLKKDMPEALRQYDLAVKQGSTEAQERIDFLKRKAGSNQSALNQPAEAKSSGRNVGMPVVHEMSQELDESDLLAAILTEEMCGNTSANCLENISLGVLESYLANIKQVSVPPEMGTIPESIVRHELAKRYAGGIGVKKDIPHAMSLYQQAADHGYGPSQLALGMCHANSQKGTVKERMRKAAHWYKLAAAQNIAEAQFALGQSYMFAGGVARDKDKAIELYKKSADQGFAFAEFAVASFYVEGREGFEGGIEKAKSLYLSSAEKGVLDAQYALAGFYEHGTFFEKDPFKAVKWYRAAAEQKYPPAYVSLGRCYEKGIGVEKDEKKAVEMYQTSAKLEHPEAQHALGLCYEKGLGGLEKKPQKSIILFKLAAEKGFEPAKVDLERLQNVMGHKQKNRVSIDAQLHREAAFIQGTLGVTGRVAVPMDLTQTMAYFLTSELFRGDRRAALKSHVSRSLKEFQDNLEGLRTFGNKVIDEIKKLEKNSLLTAAKAKQYQTVVAQSYYELGLEYEDKATNADKRIAAALHEFAAQQGHHKATGRFAALRLAQEQMSSTASSADNKADEAFLAVAQNFIDTAGAENCDDKTRRDAFSAFVQQSLNPENLGGLRRIWEILEGSDPEQPLNFQGPVVAGVRAPVPAAPVASASADRAPETAGGVNSGRNMSPSLEAPRGFGPLFPVPKPSSAATVVSSATSAVNGSAAAPITPAANNAS